MKKTEFYCVINLPKVTAGKKFCMCFDTRNNISSVHLRTQKKTNRNSKINTSKLKHIAVTQSSDQKFALSSVWF